tara:strand:- start:1618 stop:2193 length:576 start_codon:yes stop_codon:yes gene_type:complete
MITEIKIVENFLTPTYHKELLNSLDSPNMPWYLQKNISFQTDNKLSHKNFGFNRTYYDENGWRLDTDNTIDIIKPAVYQIMDTVGGVQPLRVRADMTMQSDEEHKHGIHIDYPTANITTILYINDSDGDTIFYEERTSDTTKRYQPNDLSEMKRVTPVANSLVIFDGFQLHTGCSPIKNSNRILINSNYLV